VYQRQSEAELGPYPADDEACLFGDADASLGREGSRSDPGGELGPVPAKGTSDLRLDPERALQRRARSGEPRLGRGEEQAGTSADAEAQSGQTTRRDCRLEHRMRFDDRGLAERQGIERPARMPHEKVESKRTAARSPPPSASILPQLSPMTWAPTSVSLVGSWAVGAG
jgi:hypothetical protein